MSAENWPTRNIFKASLYAAFALGIAFSLDAIGALLASSPQSTHFTEDVSANISWHADLRSLPDGEYYLSGGRIKGRCSVSFDSHAGTGDEFLADSPIHALFIGLPIQVSHGLPTTVTISCRPQAGFKNGLADQPVILPVRLGKLLELYRALIYVLLGPILALVLISECIGRSSTISFGQDQFRQRVGRSLLFFGLVALGYALSLGRMPRLFLDNYSTTYLHIALRTLVSFAFLEIVAKFHRRSQLVVALYAALFLSDLLIGVIFSKSAEVLVTFYKWHHPFYALSTFYVWTRLIRERLFTREIDWLQTVTGTWAVTQTIDAIFNIFDSGTYKSPLVIVLVTVGLIVLRRKEIWVTARIEIAVRNILQNMSGNSNVTMLLTRIAEAVFRETSFKRFSIYLDHYCLGKSDVPRRRFERIAEFGYKKDTRNDSEITFNEKRGLIMEEALAAEEPIFRLGKDRCWFCVIPLGKLGCLNLSNDIVTDVVTAHESYQIVLRLRAVLDNLADKLLADSIRRNTYLERIKTVRGNGEWPVRMGAIFLDVVDFSANVKKYKMLAGGNDLFGRFITATYLPALIKAIAPFAYLEKSVGDLLYLVVLPDLLPEEINIETAFVSAIVQIMEFVRYAGARLCAEAGLPSVRLRVGTFLGEATIICDEFQVRTVGDTVNFASRLLDNAPSGMVLVQSQLSHLFESGPLHSIGDKDVLENKDYLSARILALKEPLEESA